MIDEYLRNAADLSDRQVVFRNRFRSRFTSSQVHLLFSANRHEAA